MCLLFITTEAIDLFSASSNHESPSHLENNPFDCLQNMTSLVGKSSSPGNMDWRQEVSVGSVCPTSLSSNGDTQTYLSSFTKTNCRFSMMKPYAHYHQGLYSSTQEQGAIQHPYAMGHHFGAHGGDYSPSCYRYMPGELYPGNFLKGQDSFVNNGFVNLPISSTQNGGSLNNPNQDFSN